MVLLISIPFSVLPSATFPVTSVPTMLPRMSTPDREPLKPTPYVLDEITLPVPGDVPPISMYDKTWPIFPTSTPLPLLPNAPVPLWSVPIKFPYNELPVAPAFSISTPIPFPEIRLRAAGVDPPMMLLPEPLMNRPLRLAILVVPLEFVPMKFPEMTLPAFVVSFIALQEFVAGWEMLVMLRTVLVLVCAV